MTDEVGLEVDRFALRTFQVTPAGRLASISVSGDHWADGTCSAQCLKDDVNFFGWWRGEANIPHKAPGWDCRCGIYGSLNLANLIRQYPHHARSIVAVIAAEGQTIIGSRGLRAQYARVVAFWTPERSIKRRASKQFRGAEYYKRCSKMLAAYGLERGEAPHDGVSLTPADWWIADQ